MTGGACTPHMCGELGSKALVKLVTKVFSANLKPYTNVPCKPLLCLQADYTRSFNGYHNLMWKGKPTHCEVTDK